MNDQALAILNGAIAQLKALSDSEQSTIDADQVELDGVQAKIDADKADIELQTANKLQTDQIAAALQALADGPPPGGQV